MRRALREERSIGWSLELMAGCPHPIMLLNFSQ